MYIDCTQLRKKKKSYGVNQRLYNIITNISFFYITLTFKNILKNLYNNNNNNKKKTQAAV